MKALKVTTENPELADRFNRVLGETVEAMEESGLKYVFIGGIASGGLGRPRSTHDIDVFVRPEDAELALRALSKRGFRTEKTDPQWLYKGFKENILVDIIFKSKGEIYLDHEMYQRMIKAEFHGKQLSLVAPEDLIIIKALAHSEVTPGHWHDALALLSHATIDWEYLIKRARKAPRRVLSLLLYAQSSDILIPKSVIDQLYKVIFGDSTHHGITSVSGQVTSPSRNALKSVLPRIDHYAVARLREKLAEDSRTNELDIQIEHSENKILLRGEVMTQERRDSVVRIAQETFPNCQLESQIRISHFAEPVESEEVK